MSGATNLYRRTDAGKKYDECYTLTVSGLRKILAEHPDDMPVMCTWEGLDQPIRTGEHWQIRKPEDWDDECAQPSLIFDVEL